MVISLILASFISQKPAITNGLICMALLGLGLVRELVRGGRGGSQAVKDVILDIDYFTLALLAGLFIIIGGLTKVGVIERISLLIVHLGGRGGSTFVVFSVVVWLSVLVSGFVDNIPYVATMLPVVQGG